MPILSRVIKDKPLLKLIRRYLRTGIMDGGVVSVLTEGTPRGSPLSPILSNILLDELDKELESRALRFVRCADDISIYVKSKRSAQRVLRGVTTYLEKVLFLKVNTAKSKVSLPSKSSLLGFTFGKSGSLWKPRISSKSKGSIKDKIKLATKRNRSVDIEYRLRKLSQITQGWLSYYKLAECGVFLKVLDCWIGFRIRMCIWKS